MDSEGGYPDGRVPLRRIEDPGPDGPLRARRDSMRRVRRTSNWTAAALMVGTGAAAVALAHQAFPKVVPAVGTAGQAAGTGTSTSGTGASAQGTTGSQVTSGPQVTHSVATTTASGVTVITTTRTVNGKTVVTQVRNAPAHTDD